MLIRFLVLSLAVAQLSGQAPLPSGADLDWVEQNLRATRDQVMPIGAPDQVAAYRTSRDRFTDMAESYFSINRFRPDPTSLKESYTATLTMPVGNALRGELFGTSLRAQLLQLHMADRAASLETLLLGVTVRRTRLTIEQCPAITSRLDALHGSIAVPARQKYIALHPVIHEVFVSVPEAHIKASFNNPDSGLVQWALETLDALKKCAA